MDSKIENSENILEKLDIFGIGINIRFSQKQEHTTKFGGFVTLSIFAVLIIQINIILMNFIDSSNPTLLYEEKYTELPIRTDMNLDKFSFAFGIIDKQQELLIDPSLYKTSFILNVEEQIKDESTDTWVTHKKTRQISTVQCTKQHFKVQETQQYFYKLDLKNLLCVDSEEQDLYIEGQINSRTYTWLQILIESCSNINTCIQSDEVNKNLQNISLVMYYSDNAVIPSNKENPFKTFGSYQNWISSKQFTKEIQIRFRDTYLITDEGFLLQELKTDRKLKYSSFQTQTYSRVGDIIFDCQISLDRDFYDEYRRSYLKIDKALAQIGGTFNVLFTIGAIICKPISQVDLNRKLINSIFNFEDKQNKKKDKKNVKHYKGKICKNNECQFCKTEMNNSLQQNSNTSQQISNTSQQIHNSSQQISNTSHQINNSVKSIQYCQNIDTVKECKTEKQIEEKQNNQKQTVDSPIVNMIAASNKNSLLKRSITNSHLEVRERGQSIYSRSKDNSSLTQSVKDQIDSKDKQTEELNQLFNKQNNRHISFKSWEHFVNFFKISNMCRTRKQKLLQKGVDKLYHHIDVFYLIQKLIEVEKLKYLLLNENQIKLFEFIPKPLLTTKERRISHISDRVGLLNNNQKSQKEKINDARDAFSKIINQQNKISKIDIRIMELLDPKFKQFTKDLEVLGDQSQLQQSHFQNEMESEYQLKKHCNIEDYLTANQTNEVESEITSENLVYQNNQMKSIRINLAAYSKETKHNEINSLSQYQSVN